MDQDIIREAFTKKDRKKLWVAETIVNNPELKERDAISWLHKSGHLGYLMLNRGDDISGIILETAPMKEAGKVCMCDFCLSVYNTSKMSRFTYRKSKTESVSHYLCSGLDCVDRITNPDSNEIHSMRETLSKEERIERYYERVEEFWLNNVEL